ncbi:MAG: hypothetical protein DMD98_21690 [Candidatus Rokuibacteriota bacterium]|nr:MAG: hypothetical protein DMD98_21690 [Candidatus Rokubacteria bacterium]
MYNRILMPGRRLRLPLILALPALLAPLVTVTPAHAHGEPAPATVTLVAAQRAHGVATWSAPPSAAMPAGASALVAGALALALVALACASGRRRARRIVAAVLGLLLAVLAFESGVHSVHHAAAAAPSHCAVASAVAHLTGDVAATLDALPAPAAQRRSGAHSDDRASVVRPLRPDSGRAPPPLA